MGFIFNLDFTDSCHDFHAPVLVLLPGNMAPQQGWSVPQGAATSHGTKSNHRVRGIPVMLN